MDVFSEVLAICRSEHAVTARFALGAPWGLDSAGVPGVVIRLARGAPYWMEIAGAAPLRVDAGDLVLVRPGVAHRIVSSPGAAATPFATLIARHAVGVRGENPLVFAHGGPGDFTDLFSAQIWFSAYCRHSVLQMLPPFIHVREADLPLAGVLGAAMQALVEETLARRPGWRLSAARMGELLLVNLLREHVARAAATVDPGWLRGLADAPLARAMMAMHRAPGQAWTLASLAREAGLSRTRFSERFRERVGVTPIGYLTAHRMALAAQALEGGGQPLARIAEDAGYGSAKEFSRAFRRWSGLAPSPYLRREAARRAHVAGAPADDDAPLPAHTLTS
ncbi:MAG: AraC family transcriptional regulator [Burkholderiales bacterium]|jgi:AraC-like DNA-binding protein|nr:AraC family transcriptional regulator [Burkholderiales bacterium]